MINMQKTQTVILAAGEGKRMKSALPKVLIPLQNKPVIQYLLDSVRASGISEKPCLVVGKNAGIVKKTLGPSYEYVFQRKRLGTGHALKMCRPFLEKRFDAVLTLYGDTPFVSAETLRHIQNTHEKSGAVITMTTFTPPDFKGWRDAFYHFGRVTRNAKGYLEAIIEYKDCTEEQKKIRELSLGYFVFEADWLWKNINKLSNKNNQKEYFLVELVHHAVAQNKKIETVSSVDSRKALGINTPEQLKVAERFLSKKYA